MHVNLPDKFELARDLKSLRLPLWEERIGQGYPMLAEGIIGTFYIPNILVFFLLPFNLAWPTIYLVTLLLAAYGMLALLKYLKLMPAAAVFGAIAFSFSSGMILRLQHINLIEALSLFPWIMLFFLKFSQKSRSAALVLAFLLSQLFFVGFVQIYVYFSLLLLILAGLAWFFEKKTTLSVSFLKLSVVIVFSLVLSAVQLLPSLELKAQAERSSINARTILADFPLLPRHLVSFINPYLSGSNADGTFNNADFRRFGHFLESTNYIGLLPFALFVLGAIYLARNRPKDIFFLFGIALVPVFLLALGKYSPSFFLYIFPPLNSFRVPARFMLLFQFLAIILAAYFARVVAGRLRGKYGYLFYPALIIFTVVDLYFNFWSYNPIGKLEEWLAPGEVSHVLNLDGATWRFDSFDPNTNWNDIFEKSGWKGKDEYYKFFLNSNIANFNLVADIASLSLSPNSGLPTKRYKLWQYLVRKDIKLEDGKIVIGEKASERLAVSSVKYLISALPIEAPGYRQIFETNRDQYKYFVYESQDARARASFYYEWQKINSLTEYAKVIESIDLTRVVALEGEVGEKLEAGESRVTFLETHDEKLRIEVETEGKGLLVVSDASYPGWEAKVDSRPVPIMPANVNSRAVLVDSGKHVVEFLYRPKSFIAGAIVSLLAYLALVGFLVYSLRHKKYI